MGRMQGGVESLQSQIWFVSHELDAYQIRESIKIALHRILPIRGCKIVLKDVFIWKTGKR